MGERAELDPPLGYNNNCPFTSNACVLVRVFIPPLRRRGGSLFYIYPLCNSVCVCECLSSQFPQQHA
jgi:hypothetical protein